MSLQADFLQIHTVRVFFIVSKKFADFNMLFKDKISQLNTYFVSAYQPTTRRATRASLTYLLKLDRLSDKIPDLRNKQISYWLQCNFALFLIV